MKTSYCVVIMCYFLSCVQLKWSSAATCTEPLSGLCDDNNSMADDSFDALTSEAESQHNFLLGDDDFRKPSQFLRFGRGDIDHKFIRFGRADRDELGHRFLRFGRDPIGHKFMRFGRSDDPEDDAFQKRGKDIHHNFMRFGRSQEAKGNKVGHDFVRFGRIPEHKFMRFGRK